MLQTCFKTPSNQDAKGIQQDFGNPVCLILFLWAWELSAISPARFQLLVRSLQLQQCFPGI